VTNLGTLGGSASWATSINDAGQIGGNSINAAGVTRGFIWENGVMTELPDLPGATMTYGQWINSDGSMLAGTSTVGGFGHGCVRTDGVAQDIGTLGGKDTNALYMSKSGVLVGNSRIASGRWNAYVWNNGVMTNLNVLGNFTSNARGINSAGVITGEAYTASTGPSTAYIWDNGIVTNIGGLGGATSTGAAINDSGDVAGFAKTPSGNTHGFFWSKGVMTEIGTFGGPDSLASRMEEGGRALGWAQIAGGVRHAMAWENGVMIDLNTRIVPNVGWVLNAVSDSNNLGEIVGWATKDGQERGFLLQPASPGDANGDGRVDGLDLAWWQIGYDPLGQHANTWEMGDWNGDGKIDGGDLALWQQYYAPLGYLSLGGAQVLNAPVDATSVPEPATAGLALLAAGVLAFVRRRRRA
jgi:MYXO-CTERM domain-containing protein